MTVFNGTSSNDVFDESSDIGADTFNLRKGGNDTVLAGSGNDRFNLGTALNAADRLDGGAGNDVVILHGDYSAGLTLDDQTIQNIEQLALKKGFDYDLTLADGNVAAGQFLKVNGFGLGAGDSLTFNGAAESDGRLLFYGGAGNDTLTGGAKSDRFNLTTGGNDTVHGGDGNDIIVFGAAFTTSDVVDGGAGRDTLELNGTYTPYVFGAGQLTGVETLKLDAGHNYGLTTNDANVAAGNTLTVDASALTSSNTLGFNGSFETNGSFNFIAGAGTASLSGGSGNDTFDLTRVGGGHLFEINGRGGDDTFLFDANFSDPVNLLTGGGGDDTLELNGDYASVFFSTEIQAIDTFRFDGGHTYGDVQIYQSLTDGPATVDASQVSTLFQLTARSNTYNVEVGSGGMTASSDGGNDTFTVTSLAALAASTLDAGDGSDTLVLDGDFSAGLTFTAAMVAHFEALTLGAGHDYDIGTVDATVDAGTTFTVDGSALTSGLFFAGTAETDGHFAIIDGAGAGLLEGGGLSDTFDLSRSNGTFAYGGGGDDSFTVTSTAGLANVFIDGGSGFNTLVLNGDFSAATAITASNVTNLEALQLQGATNSYNLSIYAGVAGDDIVTVDASAAASLTLDTSNVAIAHFVVTGSAGNDHFIGGNNPDTYTGGAGADTFAYTDAAQSTSTTYDTITDFAAGTDKFDTPTTVLAAVPLIAALDSGGSFDNELSTDIGNSLLLGAVVLEVNGGTLINHTFLIVDGNGSGQYEGGFDYVIDITGYTGTITATDFA
jgi:hypothetical protein